VKLHIAIDLAVWKETETYQAGRAPSFRVGDLYCTIGRDAPEDRLELLTCRSPLRWPSGWMTTDYPDGRLRNFQGSMATLREATRANYSPLPAALDLNNVEMEISGREPSDDPGPIRFGLSEPVAFVTKEFEATVDLADYLVE
jgi:hypothetical protein